MLFRRCVAAHQLVALGNHVLEFETGGSRTVCLSRSCECVEVHGVNRDFKTKSKSTGTRHEFWWEVVELRHHLLAVNAQVNTKVQAHIFYVRGCS